jgi:hypothetical protein
MRLLRDLVQRKGSVSEKVIDDKTIFFIFGRIIQKLYGEQGRKSITPIVFRNGIIVARTKNPLWANEIMLYQDVLKDNLNKEIGQSTVIGVKPVN